MKIIFALFTFSLVMASATVNAAGYEPFKFRCSYSAGRDGIVTVNSNINPDNDDMTVILQGSNESTANVFEADSAFVYREYEDVNPITNKRIKDLAKKLNLRYALWFSTTEITLFKGEPREMKFFKFNSDKGGLGVGLVVQHMGQDILTVCR